MTIRKADDDDEDDDDDDFIDVNTYLEFSIEKKQEVDEILIRTG